MFSCERAEVKSASGLPYQIGRPGRVWPGGDSNLEVTVRLRTDPL
jgi:hypothetical protein